MAHCSDARKRGFTMAKKKVARKSAVKKSGGTKKKKATSKSAPKKSVKGKAAKKTAKGETVKRKAAKRELIDTGRDKRYVRRDTEGKFKESDDVGRSLSQDRRRKAKTKSKPGQGDKGDRQ